MMRQTLRENHSNNSGRLMGVLLARRATSPRPRNRQMRRRLLVEMLEQRRVLDAELADAGLPDFNADDGDIVINNIAGAALAIALGSQHRPVVELSLGGGLCSGTLVDMRHIITAQHCTFGKAAGVMTVNFHADNNGVEDFTRTVTTKFEVNATNTLLDGTDVAILRMSSDAPAGFTPMRFGTSNPTGVQTRMVGFGLNGLGSVGHGGTRDGLRWGADNRIDAFGAARGVGGGALGGTANIFNTDFDNGTAAANTLSPGVVSSAVPLTLEGTTAPGDSGGPLIVNNQVVGVLSGGTTNTSQFGDISWWTGTTNHRAFIEARIPGAIFGNTIRLPSDGNANRLRIARDAGGANIQFFLDADGPGAAAEQLVNSQPVGSLTSLVVLGSNQNDELVVDYVNGNPIPTGGLIFSASTGVGDRLRTTGGGFTSITETFSSASGGTVQLVQPGATRNIVYSGVESVQLNPNSVSNLTFNLPNVANPGVVVGNDLAGAIATSEIRGTTFADTAFRNPTSSLTVNGGTLADSITMLVMDPGFSPNVITTLNGGNGDDTLVGNSLANRLQGGAGNDLKIGGGGNDTYLFDTDLALGTDTLNEAGGGFDTLDFSSTTTRNIAVNLALAGAQFVNAGLTLLLGAVNTFEKVIGGSLNDVITGNALNNILLGGGGNDLLRGGFGRDLLIGGLGSDTLLGESGDDLLIAGRTSHDNNQAALLIILTEWADVAKSYNTRVTNLRAGVGGIRLLGSGVGATVFTDGGLVDNLTGSTDADWFFAALNDNVTDKAASEFRDTIFP